MYKKKRIKRSVDEVELTVEIIKRASRGERHYLQGPSGLLCAFCKKEIYKGEKAKVISTSNGHSTAVLCGENCLAQHKAEVAVLSQKRLRSE